MLKRVLSAIALSVLIAGGLAPPAGAVSLMDWGKHIAKEGNGTPGSTACMECHRLNGGGMPSIGAPRIAGQPRRYIAREIREVQAGKRYGPVMSGVVQNLSGHDIQAVALYYSRVRTTKLRDVGEPDPSLVSKGRRIATRGLWAKNIPACVQCHGPAGYGVPPLFPYIAGQNRTYLLRQLMAYAYLRRQDDPQGLMRGIARRLTPEERKAVAEYFSSLQPPDRDVP